MTTNIFSILMVTLALMACTSIKKNPTEKVATEDYELLPMNAQMSDYVGKKVHFKARICTMEMEHMIRFSLEETNEYFCIDQMNDEGEAGFQMLAYTNASGIDSLKKYKEKIFSIYGKLGSTTGAGKGGEEHTEYFLELDKVE
jgi:hypothetical protein